MAVTTELLTPRMCGVGDAITTGTNADTGTNPDREYSAEIAARPRRPYHAFVSACSRCFATLFQCCRVDACDGHATLCHDILLRIDIRIISINTSSKAPQRTVFDGKISIQSLELTAKRSGDAHNAKLCGDNDVRMTLTYLPLRPTRSASIDKRQSERVRGRFSSARVRINAFYTGFQAYSCLHETATCLRRNDP